jgi:hypothetical protein
MNPPPVEQNSLVAQAEVLFKIHASTTHTKVGQSLEERKAFISSVNDFSSSVNINFLFDYTVAARALILTISRLFVFGERRSDTF